VVARKKEIINRYFLVLIDSLEIYIKRLNYIESAAILKEALQNN